MSDLSPEAAERLVRLDEQLADVQRRADQAAQLSAEVDAMRESGTSAGREVSVEVDSVGRLTGISFTSAAYALSPDELGEVVLDTVQTARARAGHAVMAKVEATFGADSATAATMRETFIPPEPPADGPTPPRGPRPGQGPMLYTRR
nr:YbaB/EbfC family nucleoid-associated protein [Propionicimonas sp.]